MKSWLNLVCSVTVLLTGCADKIDDLADAEWDWRNDREYLATWSMQGVPLLEVELSYHGKEPSLPFGGPEPGYDWRTRDTDFYSATLRNLTNHPIRLLEVRVELAAGSGNEGVKDGAHLAERWGSDVIPPGGSVSRRNTWVWGKGDENTLTKTYRAEIMPAEDTPSASPAPPALPEEGHRNFAFQLPLRYKR